MNYFFDLKFRLMFFSFLPLGDNLKKLVLGRYKWRNVSLKTVLQMNCNF